MYVCTVEYVHTYELYTHSILTVQKIACTYNILYVQTCAICISVYIHNGTAPTKAKVCIRRHDMV